MINASSETAGVQLIKIYFFNNLQFHLYIFEAQAFTYFTWLLMVGSIGFTNLKGEKYRFWLNILIFSTTQEIVCVFWTFHTIFVSCVLPPRTHLILISLFYFFLFALLTPTTMNQSLQPWGPPKFRNWASVAGSVVRQSRNALSLIYWNF